MIVVALRFWVVFLYGITSFLVGRIPLEGGGAAVDNSGVFWNMFMKSGSVGSYLLYKHCEKDSNLEETANEADELCEVASERG